MPQPGSPNIIGSNATARLTILHRRNARKVFLECPQMRLPIAESDVPGSFALLRVIITKNMKDPQRQEAWKNFRRQSSQLHLRSAMMASHQR
jgi:hypothetical protein